MKFGVWLSKTFVDAPERNERSVTTADKKMRLRKKGRYLMNLHNNEVGRLVSESLTLLLPSFGYVNAVIAVLII